MPSPSTLALIVSEILAFRRKLLDRLG